MRLKTLTKTEPRVSENDQIERASESERETESEGDVCGPVLNVPIVEQPGLERTALKLHPAL